MSSVDVYDGEKEGQQETKIQKEIQTVEIERIIGERRVC